MVERARSMPSFKLERPEVLRLRLCRLKRPRLVGVLNWSTPMVRVSAKSSLLGAFRLNENGVAVSLVEVNGSIWDWVA